jgi:hypothetical protein
MKNVVLDNARFFDIFSLDFFFQEELFFEKSHHILKNGKFLNGKALRELSFMVR